jgi:hypothetical protein
MKYPVQRGSCRSCDTSLVEDMALEEVLLALPEEMRVELRTMYETAAVGVATLMQEDEPLCIALVARHREMADKLSASLVAYDKEKVCAAKASFFHSVISKTVLARLRKRHGTPGS